MRRARHVVRRPERRDSADHQPRDGEIKWPLIQIKVGGVRGCKSSETPHPCRCLRHRVQILLVLSAWFLATGSQWDVAQVFAWGRMFAGYSREMTVAAAVEKTFSGEMCAICRIVRKAKQEQDAKGAKTPEARTPGKVLDVCPLVASTRVFSPARQAIGIVPAQRMMAGRDRMAPPLPPPRFVA